MSITNTLTGPTVGIMGVPQEFLCTLSAPSVGNVNPFDIDPEQTTLITSGLTSSD